MKKLLLLALMAALVAGTGALAQRGGDRRGGPSHAWPNAQYYTPQPRTVPTLPAGCVVVTAGGADYYYGATGLMRGIFRAKGEDSGRMQA